MNFKKLLNPALLLLAALVWGVAFVAQKSGANEIGPFLLLAARSFVGVVALLPVILILGKKAPQPKVDVNSKKPLYIGSLLCGTLLFVASAFQQIGISEGTDAGKAGFITALYIVLVPIVSIFLGSKTSLRVWISVLMAVVGLFLLCVKNGFSVQVGDILTLVCAFVFTFHILVVDRFSPKVEVLKMSCMQFLVCGILALITMFITGEQNTIEGLKGAYIEILYLGVMSSGVGYTLQMVGQRDTNPTLASILMSLESVFAVLAGTLFGERLSLREGVGCIIMFAAIILAQLPTKNKCE